ncbi:MAG: isocitrate/isopropylmalate family dehydrogenase [Thermoanaerobaculia bacterium]|nr:isocitrate/isopropylmalate family dehydrogenase [Thermoanaerobaculia bacterium]
MTRVALLVGGGIGAEIVTPVLEVVSAAGADVDWQRVDLPIRDAGELESSLEAAVDAVKDCGVGLKTRLFAPTEPVTPRGDVSGTHNPNVLLRQRLGLYAGVVPIRPLPGAKTRYPGVDLVLIRENTEDIYTGIEHEIVPGVVESLKVVTRAACERLARFAYRAIRTLGRRHLSFVHKANIMKMTDGLFLDVVREVAKEHPDVGYREVIVDAACMQLVLDPLQFDVLLTGNLYGDLLSNLGSGLAGGISGAHSINIGDELRVYEAVHGDAEHLTGRGIANPLPLLSPTLALLRHLGEDRASQRIERAVERVLVAGSPVTPDLGGTATTGEMAAGLIAAMAEVD